MTQQHRPPAGKTQEFSVGALAAAAGMYAGQVAEAAYPGAGYLANVATVGAIMALASLARDLHALWRRKIVE